MRTTHKTTVRANEEILKTVKEHKILKGAITFSEVLSVDSLDVDLYIESTRHIRNIYLNGKLVNGKQGGGE